MVRMNRFVRLIGVLFGLVAASVVVTGCEPALPGTVTPADPISEEPTVALSLYQDSSKTWLYAIDENGKLTPYDVTDPKSPQKGAQADAFKDDSFQIVYERSNLWLVLVGKSGQIKLFDIRDPRNPKAVWSGGKTLQLKSKGPLMIRPDLPVMYISPGGGTAVTRVDLASLSGADTDQAKLDAATRSFSGGGGGGIVMPMGYDRGASGLTPLRVYVANKDTGKIDVWNIGDIEGSDTSKKPIASIDLQIGKDLVDLKIYQEGSEPDQTWLLAVNASGDVEYFDTGKNHRDADGPKSTGKASVPGLIGYLASGKVMIGDQLAVYTFSEALETPTKVAIPEVGSELNLRAVVVHKDFIITAETGGCRVYQFTTGAQ